MAARLLLEVSARLYFPAVAVVFSGFLWFVARLTSKAIMMSDKATVVSSNVPPAAAGSSATESKPSAQPSSEAFNETNETSMSDRPLTDNSDNINGLTIDPHEPSLLEASSQPATSQSPAISASSASRPSLEEAQRAAEQRKDKGNEFFRNRQFEEAAREYSAALSICEQTDQPEAIGTRHVYLCNRAFCNIKLENFGSAIMDAERALSFCPSSSKAYYRRGSAYVALGKFNLALKDFQTANRLKADPDTEQKIKQCQKELRQRKFAEAIVSDKGKPLSETVDLDILESGLESYTGPRYRREPEFLLELTEYLKTPENVLHKKDAFQIVIDMIELLKATPTLVHVDIQPQAEFTVCGDIHGQFYDLLNIFKINGLPSENNPYLFNGDFVDRGSFSLECILTLFVAKLIYPSAVHLSRGNHETRNMNKLYGFQGEVTSKYNLVLYELFCEAFCWLPLAHVLNKKVFVVHGGLFARDGVTLSEIERLDRNMEPPDAGIMAELLWSDPQPECGRSPSKRGVACAFGPDVTTSFLKENKLDYVIRSHEVKQLGYEVEHDGKLITVFSAPNYCDQMGNEGAFIRLKGKDMKPVFSTFSAVPHPPVRAMQYANPLFSLFG